MQDMTSWIARAVLLFLGLGIPALLGQFQARLTGVVTDPSGLPAAGAAVEVVNMATGVDNRTRSNESGLYAFPFLPPGTYELRCHLDGFKAMVQGGIVLETGIVRSVDLRLELGSTTESISVTAATPLLESETSNVGQLIERQSVFQLPLESRRVGSLMRLVGGVAYVGEVSGAEAAPSFAMAGGRSRDQAYTTDGITNSFSTIGVGQVSMNPPAESMQEFKAETNNYSVEMGRSGGGFIQMTTRSGTNEFHGALYEFFRNDKLDARTFFAPSKAPLRFNVFGGSIGGPVIRNRTFFFFNYEGTRQRVGQTFSSDAVPHPADRSGDFSRRRDVTVLDPVTRQPFAGNLIPPSRLDPVGVALVNYYPLPNAPSSDVTRAPVSNFVTNASDVTDQGYYVGRVDHAQGENDRFFARYMRNSAEATTAIAWPGISAVADPRSRPRPFTFQSLGGSWIHNFSPTLFNEFRYGYLDLEGTVGNTGMDSGVAGAIGLKGVDPAHFPQVNVTGLTRMSQTRVKRSVVRAGHELVNNLTWIQGAHQVKFGFNYMRSNWDDKDRVSPSGAFTFTNRATGEGLAALLLGWTTSATISEADIVNHGNYYAAFVGDDWKVAPALTLNLGLRWEMMEPPIRDGNKWNSFDQRAINPVSGTLGVITFAPFPETGPLPHKRDINNWSPRFGFAWRPGSNWVVRGGYGLFFARPWRTIASSASAGFADQASFPSPDGGFTPPFLFKDGMPPLPPRNALGPEFGAVRVGQAAAFAPEFFETNAATGYNHQYNLTVQKLMGTDLLLQAIYLGNLGHRLFGDNLNINMTPLVNGRGPARQDQTARLYPQFGNVTVVSPPLGNSAYHALTVKLEKRFSRGLGLLTHYTWSKFLEDVATPGDLSESPVGGYTHIELRNLDRSLSGNHLTHRYVMGAVYEFPWRRGRGPAVLDQILGGWSMAPILELRSGPTLAVAEQTNMTNTFSNAQRPTLLRNPTLSGGRSNGERVAQYFDTGAFVFPGVGVFGSAPRTFCCGPGFAGVDVSAQKRFNITERVNLQFRGDFYNLTNRPNFGLPGTLRGNQNFGRISSTIATSREVQLGLRLEF